MFNNLLALLSGLLRLIGTIEKLSFKQLYGYNSKYELEPHVHDEDIEHVLQRVHHTVKHSLWKKTQNTEY